RLRFSMRIRSSCWMTARRQESVRTANCWRPARHTRRSIIHSSRRRKRQMADKKKKTGQGKTLKKVFRHLGKYRIFVVFSVLLATVSVALTLYIPKLTGHAVDYIV